MPTQRDRIKLAPDEAKRFLDQSRRLILATNGRDGWPHLVAMFYVVDNHELLMTTYGKSQKAVNIARDPRATVLIESGQRYDELKGLMLRGRAEIVRDVEFTARVLAKVGEKMSGVAVSPEQQTALLAQAAKRVVIRFRPERSASWDHSKLSLSHSPRSA